MFLFVSSSCNTAHYDALQHTTPFRCGAVCAFMCVYPVSQHIATHCSAPRHSGVEGTPCNTGYCNAAHCTALQRPATHHAATHCNTAHCNALQHTPRLCAVTILQHSTMQRTTMHHAATHHLATHCSTLHSYMGCHSMSVIYPHSWARQVYVYSHIYVMCDGIWLSIHTQIT